MAQLFLSAAGAVIGSFIPGVGPQIGWMVGPTMGGALMLDDISTNQDVANESLKHIDCPDTRPDWC